MKTITAAKFERIILDGFHAPLQPLGFRKKASNFYRQLEQLGHIINIQKSSGNTTDEIRFTINTGIFVPEYWLAHYNRQDKGLPAYPTEPECFIRKRIGALRNQPDTWYTVRPETDEQLLITAMQQNLRDVILPYFEQTNSRDKLMATLSKEQQSQLSALLQE